MVKSHKKSYVFDSFSILSFFKGEKGANKTESLLNEISEKKADGFISVINLTEVFYIIAREKDETAASMLIRSTEKWGIRAVIANKNTALKAGVIKAKYPMSLADAFCVATANELSAIIVTGDPEFKQVTEAEIIWL